MKIKNKKDDEELLRWAVLNEPRFEGDKRKALEFYMSKGGLKAAYEESLKKWNPPEASLLIPSSQFATKKLINSITYFLAHTKNCNDTKLFSLLNFLDFEIYSKTGRNVTGLVYVAYKDGPLPPKLKNNIIDRTEKSTYFNSKWFTNRELSTLKKLADTFCDATNAELLVHERNNPWRTVWSILPMATISYRHALKFPDSISEKEADEIQAEYNETRLFFTSNFP